MLSSIRASKLFTNPMSWIGITMSILCVFFAVRFSGVDDLLSVVGTFRIDMAVGCFLVTTVHLLVRNRRWQIILEEKTSFISCLWAQGIGFLFTFHLPLRLGDPARLITLSKIERISAWSVGASIVIERILDVVVTLIIIVALGFFIDFRFEWAESQNQVAVAIGVIFFVVIFVSFLRQFNLSPWMTNIVGRIYEFSRRSLSHLKKIPTMKSVVFWTAVGWVIGITRHWLGIAAFVSDATFLEATLLTVMLALATAVPSAPGFIGVFQIVGQQALVLPFPDRFDPATALSITLILHLSLYAACMLIGVISAWAVAKKLKSRNSMSTIFASLKKF